jgi:hypothetical protein
LLSDQPQLFDTFFGHAEICHFQQIELFSVVVSNLLIYLISPHRRSWASGNQILARETAMIGLGFAFCNQQGRHA